MRRGGGSRGGPAGDERGRQAGDDRTQSFSDVMAHVDRRLADGVTAQARAWPTGFPVLDTYLGGGLRPGELTLVGGREGIGKSIFALQVARNVVVAGQAAVYVSYQDTPTVMLQRLLAMEAAEKFGLDGVPQRRVREALEAADGLTGLGGLAERLGGTVGGQEAVQSLQAWADRLVVHRASGVETSVEAVRTVVEQVRSGSAQPPLVVVDYLQKMHVLDEDSVEKDRVTRVVEGLKDLAVGLEAPVLAVVAADRSLVRSGQRLRIQHLRGSSALAYEADVILVMNDKYDVVARHQLMYDVAGAERFRNWVVLSIEKNRSGLDGIDLELRKRFDQGRFEPDGGLVAEQLVDERVHRD